MARVTLVIALAAGCAAAGGEDTGYMCTEDDQFVTWDTWGAGFFADYCRACHSADTPDRHGAPDGVDFDTEADVATFKASIHRAVLEDGTMPIGGGVLTEDLSELEVFLACGL